MPLSRSLCAEHIPLSQRPSYELWARADEVTRMAATATSADVRVALETLAIRFAALAAKREFAETLEMNCKAVDED